MQLETFRGPELQKVVKQVRRVIGDDAMIIRSGVVRTPTGDVVEVVAARPEVIDAFAESLGGQRFDAALKRSSPYIIALVGPSGAGKTSAAVKIALNPGGVGHKRVGLITLDTYRVGAIEELQTYAELAGLPLEVVYNRFQVPEALKRLRDVDVIIIDTPGRLVDASGLSIWSELLSTISPDEVHLVIPAGLQSDVSVAYMNRFAALGLSHLLLTKLDEVPVDSALVELAEMIGLPARWVSDGLKIPSGLSAAGPRLLALLGSAKNRVVVRRAG